MSLETDRTDMAGDRPTRSAHAAEVDSGPGPGVSGKPPAKEHSPLRNGVEWVVILAAALLVAFVIKQYVVQAFYIPSGSMEHTLNIGDRVLVNKLSYRMHDIHRGDIVVFKRPPGEGPSSPEIKDLIKRVVGLPGDTVESRDGRIFINDRPLEEKYLDDGVRTVPAVEKTVVPPNSYFLMGDNRGNSRDSRFFGAVPKDLIIGRAFVRVWPLGDLSLL